MNRGHRALVGALLALGLITLPAARGAAGTLLGDPFGLRGRAAERGVMLQLYSNHFGAWVARGDAEGTTGHSGSYDLFAHIDFDRLLGLASWTALLQLKGQYDSNVNGDVAALSDPIDDADFDKTAYAGELWAQRSFSDGRIRLRAGFIETSSFFDRNAYANSEDRQFSATHLDNSAIVPFAGGLGATLLLVPRPGIELALGVVDADNQRGSLGLESAFDDLESLTSHVEAVFDLQLPVAGARLPGRWRIGVFRDGRDRRVFGRAGRGTTSSRRGHWGGYLSIDQRVMREAGDGDQGLGLFLRAGRADPQVNRIEWFFSAGLQYLGPLPGRDRDVLGLGGWQSVASARYREEIDPDFERETGFELYYKLALLPWLDVTPAVQTLIDPGGRESASTAVVGSLRMRVSW